MATYFWSQHWGAKTEARWKAWNEDSVFKNTCCSGRGFGLGSHCPRSGSQPSVTAVPGDPMTPTFSGTRHECDEPIYMQAKHSYPWNLFFNYYFKEDYCWSFTDSLNCMARPPPQKPNTEQIKLNQICSCVQTLSIFKVTCKHLWLVYLLVSMAQMVTTDDWQLTRQGCQRLV